MSTTTLSLKLSLGLACCAMAACGSVGGNSVPQASGSDNGVSGAASGNAGGESGSAVSGGSSGSSGMVGVGSSGSGTSGFTNPTAGTSGGGAGSSGDLGTSGTSGNGTTTSGSSGGGVSTSGSATGGGDSGPGGTSGTSGTAAGGGEGGAAGCPAGASFCDDFESGTTLGSAWTTDNTLMATVKVVNTYTTMPGPTMAHSGTNSVQISFTTGAGYAMIVEKMGFPAPMGYWGRVWYYVETPTDGGHDVYIEGSTGMNLQNNGVRPLNTQGGKMSINIDPAAGGGEASATATMGAIPRGAWTCFEWQISATGGTGDVVLYVSGTLAATVKMQAIPALTEQRVGYERYAAGTAGNVWIDDYAIGPTRLNCN